MEEIFSVGSWFFLLSPLPHPPGVSTSILKEFGGKYTGLSPWFSCPQPPIYPITFTFTVLMVEPLCFFFRVHFFSFRISSMWFSTLVASTAPLSTANFFSGPVSCFFSLDQHPRGFSLPILNCAFTLQNPCVSRCLCVSTKITAGQGPQSRCSSQ